MAILIPKTVRGAGRELRSNWRVVDGTLFDGASTLVENLRGDNVAVATVARKSLNFRSSFAGGLIGRLAIEAERKAGRSVGLLAIVAAIARFKPVPIDLVTWNVPWLARLPVLFDSHRNMKSPQRPARELDDGK